MTDKQGPHLKRKRRWKRRLLIALGLSIACYCTFRMLLLAGVRNRISAFQQNEQVGSLTDFERLFPTPKPEQNAAKRFAEALKLVAGRGGRSLPESLCWKISEPGQPLTKELRSEFDSCLLENRQALKACHEAAQLPGARFVRRFEFPIDRYGGLKCLQINRVLANLLRLEAVVHLENGNTEKAIQSIDTIVALAQSSRNDPGQLIQASRMVSVQLANEAIVDMMHRARVNDRQLARLQRTVRHLQREMDPNTTIQFETWVALELIDRPVLNFLPQDWQAKAPLLYSAFGIQDIDKMEMLDNVKKFREIASLPYPEILVALDRFELDRILGSSNLGLPQPQSSFIQSRARQLAMLRMTDCLLAVERLRLRYRRIPRSLNETVPEFLKEVPKDPYDGKPLRYKQGTDRYTIYSVFKDRQDDGGKPLAADPPYDFPITMEIKK